MNFMPKIPLADWISSATDWVQETFSWLFEPLREDFGDFIEIFAEDWLMGIPPWLFILIVGVIAFVISKNVGLTAFSVIGLWFIYNQELWSDLMNTFTLVIFASLISVIIGVPFGILMAKNKVAERILTPVLDFMQTMPAFVYLIPAVAFFSIGMVPGVFSSVVFATPPTVRFTNLGIRQVSKELIEASDSFGTTGTQKLFKVQLPMARATIMAGINQTVMLALSMVVIASMIGAKGLGQTVITGLQRAEVGTGFVAGLGIVILAIIIDRFTQSISSQKTQ
ncbi:glycine/betaine ABC transporter permease [Pontibacillus halophilus JSM 076056 = DSM 19796]|uniref:Glycine/betaine ABC transporter permease n=1 Tax=Pontibacillus halophilus JSM 076056 = DSM 19796 TaxID=1385510 RepID=A0A0A5GN03_9BACI|nr:proline/glycine betaine ABC transporter permease [Pontibacillus halophilus]KGX92608.1 glycine/betaine ABC transporter permease [Pontibacillus halophilus JSM 076056 = DSM 19796]